MKASEIEDELFTKLMVDNCGLDDSMTADLI